MAIQQRNAEMVNLLKADFIHKQDTVYLAGIVAGSILMLPGLVAFWPMSVALDDDNTLYADAAIVGYISTPTIAPRTVVSMPDSNITPLTTWTTVTNGLLLVVNASEGSLALFNLRGGNNTATELNDAFGVYSSTGGTPSSLNVYYSSGYKVENKRGSTAAIAVIALGI